MIPRLNPFRARISTLAILFTGLSLGATAVAQERPGGMAASQLELAAMTSEWKGDRCSDGRPKVADDLLRRLKAVSIEEAWDVLRQRGYENQFVGGWQMIHPDQPFVGRALTAAYLPSRPDLAATDPADRQGGGSGRPVQLVADRHAPEGGRLHRRRVRQGGRRYAHRR